MPSYFRISPTLKRKVVNSESDIIDLTEDDSDEIIYMDTSRTRNPSIVEVHNTAVDLHQEESAARREGPSRSNGRDSTFLELMRTEENIINKRQITYCAKSQLEDIINNKTNRADDHSRPPPVDIASTSAVNQDSMSTQINQEEVLQPNSLNALLEQVNRHYEDIAPKYKQINVTRPRRVQKYINYVEVTPQFQVVAHNYQQKSFDRPIRNQEYSNRASVQSRLPYNMTTTGSTSKSVQNRLTHDPRYRALQIRQQQLSSRIPASRNQERVVGNYQHNHSAQKSESLAQVRPRSSDNMIASTSKYTQGTSNVTQTVFSYDELIVICLLNAPAGNASVPEMYFFLLKQFSGFDAVSKPTWKRCLLEVLINNPHYFIKSEEDNIFSKQLDVYKLAEENRQMLVDKVFKRFYDNKDTLDLLRLRNPDDSNDLLNGKVKFHTMVEILKNSTK